MATCRRCPRANSSPRPATSSNASDVTPPAPAPTGIEGAPPVGGVLRRDERKFRRSPTPGRRCFFGRSSSTLRERHRLRSGRKNALCLHAPRGAFCGAGRTHRRRGHWVGNRRRAMVAAPRFTNRLDQRGHVDGPCAASQSPARVHPSLQRCGQSTVRAASVLRSVPP